MFILYTQIGSLIDALRNILIKDQKKKIVTSSLTFTWSWLIFTLVILLPLGLKDGIPEISNEFYIALAARMILDPLAIYLYNFSIQNYKISSVLPLLSFGPVFSYLVAIVVLDELPSLLASVGILLVIIGVYILNLQKGSKWYQPFLEMYKNKGNLYVLISAAIWGTLVPFFKLGNQASSTLFYTGISSLGVVIVFTLIVLIFKRKEIKTTFSIKNTAVFSSLGILDGFVLIFRMLALETGKAAVVAALNRTSIIFGAILGGILFKENIREKIVPIVIMLTGVALIALR